MAKLTAPLFSLKASGAIAKTLVYFDWKGLEVVRQYVIPANPKTDPQVEQRGWLTEAVDAIHAAMQHATKPLTAVDRSAYALDASCEATPRTWFNQIACRWMIAKVRGEHAQILAQGTFTDPATGQITITLYNHQYATEPGFMYCGTSKTYMAKKVAANGVANVHTGVFTGLAKGTKYFFQFRPTKVASDKYVARSGIYFHTCT